MIGYLLVLYLGVISVVLIDPNPLWALPLVIVLIGQLWEKRWIGLMGILLYSVVTVGRLSSGSVSDIKDLSLLVLGIVVPILILVEINLSPSPYRLQRVSLVPVSITIGIVAGFIGALLLLLNAPGRFGGIGVYLSSDPVLQIFIIMSLTIFFTGPILLGSGPPEERKEARR
jgi:hypothetical protein